MKGAIKQPLDEFSIIQYLEGMTAKTTEQKIVYKRKNESDDDLDLDEV